ncbi:hypothetical protein PTKIN_Ptkin17bG0072100 [Pterospermum kingtungense]
MVNNDGVVSTPASFRLRWDVILSFRGEDTRHGITQNLYNALKEKGVRVFRDDDGLRRGDEISPSLLEAIEDSAASKGPFEEAFWSHENRFGKEGDNRVMKWRSAMEKVGGIGGWVCNDKRDEEKLIQVLEREVLKEVYNTPVKVASYAVGLDTRVMKLINLLDIKSNGINVLGLHGMGAIGKTTLAKAIYNKIFGYFDSVVHSTHDVDANASTIRKIIHDKRVLLVLDDVNEENQLKALGARTKWRNDGSIRIIVTTRNRGVLNEHFVNLFYQVRELHFDQALELFNYHARPIKECLELSKQIVSLTGCLPLALEVFGSFLQDKRKVTEWDDALKKLRDIRPNELRDVLKISFEGLDIENQCIFLDIACLFVKMRMKREDLIDILKGCDFKAEIAVRVLEDKSLIKFTEDDALSMHDQLRDMGRQIVRYETRESVTDPGKRSRLWDRKEILTVLKNNKVHI